MRPWLPALLLMLPGCMATKVVTVPLKVVGKTAGTVVETAWDAATQTQQEADEDRGKAARKAEEQEARDKRKNEPRP
ncbi:DUF6726 family protein [Thermaurantiacus sp.]